MEYDNFLIILAVGYLVGSIPFGLILTRIFGYGDIRKIGSGNIGATNVLRTGNKFLAVATLILDGLKPIIALAIFYYFIGKSNIFRFITLTPTNESWGYKAQIPYCGTIPYANIGCLKEDMSFYYSTYNNSILLMLLFVVIGHCFPIWLKFKGGKGVATGLGGILFIAPVSGVAACIVWLLIAFATRISSLSALMAFAIMPYVTWICYGYSAGMMSFLISILIFYRHKENIKRLINGTEPKIGEKKNAAPEA